MKALTDYFKCYSNTLPCYLTDTAHVISWLCYSAIGHRCNTDYCVSSVHVLIVQFSFMTERKLLSFCSQMKSYHFLALSQEEKSKDARRPAHDVEILKEETHPVVALLSSSVRDITDLDGNINDPDDLLSTCTFLSPVSCEQTQSSSLRSRTLLEWATAALQWFKFSIRAYIDAT